MFFSYALLVLCWCSAGALLVLSWCSVCSLQKEHRSSRLGGFRVQTFAVTAAPPTAIFGSFGRFQKNFHEEKRVFHLVAASNRHTETQD